jgi:hypothetical protein
MIKGDLVWIPSQVMLYQYEGDQGTLTKYYKLDKPSSAVIVEDTGKDCRVLVNGQTWITGRSNVYELNHTTSWHISEEEENGDSKINRTF